MTMLGCFDLTYSPFATTVGRVGSVPLPPACLRARLLPILDAMTCHDARQFCRALIAGELAISEAALVEAHLSHCADCLQLVEKLYQAAPRDPEGRIALADHTGMGAGSRLLLPLLVLVALGAAALVVVSELAPYAWHRATALVAAARDETPQPSRQTAPPPPEPGQIDRPSGASLIGEPDIMSSSRSFTSSLSLAATSPSAPASTESEQMAAAPSEPSGKEAERANAAPPAPSAPALPPRRASTQEAAESAATALARKAEPRQARDGEQAALTNPEPAAPQPIS